MSTKAEVAQSVDVVTMTVIYNALQQTCEEMDIALVRSSFCPVVSESRDLASGIYRATDGEVIAQGEGGLPLFIGTMQFAVQAALATYPDWEPGDVAAMNDPYLSGTHLMDLKLVKPVFHDGRLACFLANTTHWTDIGGMAPGGFAPRATEIVQEGLRIPPIKIIKAGHRQPEVQRLILANVRLSDERAADLASQIGALVIGERRLRAIFEKYGLEVVLSAADQMGDRSEAQMRELIAEIPDGTYSYESELDGDGISPGHLRLAMDVIVTGSEITFDLTRSSPPAKGPLNASYVATASSIFLHMKHVFPEVPINGGCFRPLHVNRAPGTFVDAIYPRAVGGCSSEVTLRIGDVLLCALNPVLPDRTIAESFGTVCNFTIAGTDPATDRPYIMFSFLGGGYGGNYLDDGLTHGASSVSITKIQPWEVLESRYPVRFERFALREGSAGAGCHRGGFGVELVVTLLRGEATSSVLGERGQLAPRGLRGGQAAARTEVVWTIGGVDVRPEHVSKAADILMTPGDSITLRTPGGGGYGDPQDRDRSLVCRDVARGYIDAETARNIYECDCTALALP